MPKIEAITTVRVEVCFCYSIFASAILNYNVYIIYMLIGLSSAIFLFLFSAHTYFPAVEPCGGLCCSLFHYIFFIWS